MDNFDFSKFTFPQIDYTSLIQIPEMLEVAEEDTIWYKMEQQHKVLLLQLEQQSKNNEILVQNYNQLKELFDLQKAEYEAAKTELARSKRLNKIMLIIAIVAMLGAISSPLVTWLVTL